MAVEIVGGRENPRVDDGLGHRHLLGHREEAEEEADDRLPVGESQIPQLVGVQILYLRSLGLNQCCW